MITSKTKRNKAKENLMYSTCNDVIVIFWLGFFLLVCCSVLFIWQIKHIISIQLDNFFRIVFFCVTARERKSKLSIPSSNSHSMAQPHQFNQKYKVQFQSNIESHFFFRSRLLRLKNSFYSSPSSNNFRFINIFETFGIHCVYARGKKRGRTNKYDIVGEYAIVINLNVSRNKFTSYWWMPSVGISDWQVN